MEQQFEQFSFEAISRQFKEAADFVCQRVVNREEVVEQAICALLTGEHLLLQSRTGVGKSLLAEQLFAMFSGARVFRIQASKEQQPDSYFGALDIEELKRGRIVHNIEGSLVDSEFAFIDEIFDANDFTLRALLSVLNERQLMRGVQCVPARLHTVIAARTTCASARSPKPSWTASSTKPSSCPIRSPTCSTRSRSSTCSTRASP
jgi:hypothetical protein